MKEHVYKTLGTSIIFSPMSSTFLKKYKIYEIALQEHFQAPKGVTFFRDLLGIIQKPHSGRQNVLGLGNELHVYMQAVRDW